MPISLRARATNLHITPVSDFFSQKAGPTPNRPDRRQLLKLAAAAPLMPLVAACSIVTRGAPPPASLADQVTVLGIPNGRFWPETQVDAMARETIELVEREHATLGRRGPLPPAYFLAVSGGGDNGAFGAGLLCGWYDLGTIPTFKLATGVSTGSMIAPFAFLGGSYYDQLRTMYTTITPNHILRPLGLYGAIFGTALADTTPLFDLISSYLNEPMLADIADAYHKGRLLLIGTTSLDEQRPIIWSIGAIAASGRPGALELVRKILLASAAIPAPSRRC